MGHNKVLYAEIDNIKDTYDLSDDEIKVIDEINKELIGGFKIEVEDWVLDYSIQEKMKKMKENLLKNRKE